MSPLYLFNGALLTENGALAISENCCCFQPCCSCPEGYPLFTIPGAYTASVTSEVSSTGSDFIINNPAWAQFISCYGLNWSATLPDTPPIITLECSDNNGPFDWQYFGYNPVYSYNSYELGSFADYDSTEGIIYTIYANFYVDTEVLSTEYENCNIFALIHQVGIDGPIEYTCFEQLQPGPIRLTKRTSSAKLCLQIVQVLPEECDLEEPAPLNAIVRDITSEVLLSGIVTITPVVSSTLTDNCVEVFIDNEVNTYSDETGWDFQYSNTEALDGHLAPIYPDPIVVDTLAICATGCEQTNVTLPPPGE
jgi:hypothetical protein